MKHKNIPIFSNIYTAFSLFLKMSKKNMQEKNKTHAKIYQIEDCHSIQIMIQCVILYL